MYLKPTALGLALALGLAAAPAAAVAGDPGQGWAAPLPVSRVGADVWDLDLTMHDGRGLAVWVRWKDDGTRVMAARQRATGGWRAPTAVSGTRGAAEVEVAYDAQGQARLVWTAGRRVKAAWLRPGGSTSAPVVLHRTPAGALGTRPAYLQLSMNRVGAAAVAWQTMDDDEAPPYAAPRVQAVNATATGGWSAEHTLSAADTEGIRPEVFVSRTGRVTAVWGERAGDRWKVMTASRRDRRAWGTASPLTRPSVKAGIPHLAGLASGRLAVAYAVRSPEARGLRLRSWSPSSGWSAPMAVRGALLRSWVDVGLSRQGATVAFTDARDAVWAASVSSSSVVTRSRVAPVVSVYYGLQLVVNRAGDALVAWDSVRGGDHPIEAAYRSASGSWGPVSRVSAARGDAFLGALALTPGGDGLAVWNGGDIADPDSSLVWSRWYSAQ
ncbi:MAG TPA: hypothetical protein VFR87_03605 [Nocardioidaceae bacterium]|nr:hypothetical protein [Nocardioidaceae bacterium]